MLYLLLLACSAKFLGQISSIGSEYLQVHLFPHSHDDVGWVETVDGYYKKPQGVRQIINSYMNALLQDPTRKFIQVEIAFFTMWWNEQDDKMKKNVFKLLNQGQLHFINGGWCMNDEATPYYEDIIDQMTLGHKFLLETFNYIPNIGWQVDPFGHSSGQAQLAYLMGFDAQFFGRIDIHDREKRLQSKEMEMIYHPQSYTDMPILTHINYYGFYSSPPGFDFDHGQNGEVNYENVNQYAERFVNYFKEQQKKYRGSVICHTLGMDFEWWQADVFYKNIDQILQYVNDRKEQFQIEIKYSTPVDYIKALNRQGLSYPIKTDDFFPYKEDGYWTGYFTSRPAFKGFVRKTGRYLQVVKNFISKQQINGLSNYNDTQPILQKIYEAQGTAQHHDAVTGTAKWFVTEDYFKQLHDSIVKTDELVSNQLKVVVKMETQESIRVFMRCSLNTTAKDCEIYPALNNKSIVILTQIDPKVNNQDQDEIVTLRVPNVNLCGVDSQNKPIQGEMICSNQNDETDCEIYFVRKIYTKMLTYFKLFQCEKPTFITIKKQNFQFTPNDWINLREGNQKFKLQYNFYYTSWQNGAYLFKPESSESTVYSNFKKAYKYDGDLVKLLYIDFETVYTWIKSYKWQDDVNHIYSFVNSIESPQRKGRDVVIIVKTELNNQETFYTDSNGLELQKRKLNYRPSWKYNDNEPVTANYYPVNGMIVIEDQKTNQAAALLNDRAQGGTSLKNGELELMVHRRAFQDDNKGVYEALNEEEVVDGRKVPVRQLFHHQLVFYNRQKDPNQPRLYQYLLDQTPLQYFGLSESDQFKQDKDHLNTDLDNIVISQDKYNLVKLYLQPWNDKKFILRVHNMRDKDDFKLQFSQSYYFQERTLTANQEISQRNDKRLDWFDDYDYNGRKIDDDTLAPQQIRTYLVNLK